MPTTPPADRLTCTVEEAAALLGISRGKAYQCVRDGQLRSVHVGRRILVPKAAIDELLAGHTPPPRVGAGFTFRREPKRTGRPGLVR